MKTYNSNAENVSFEFQPKLFLFVPNECFYNLTVELLKIIFSFFY